MNKVYRYLIRKLAVEKAIEAVPEDQQADSVIEISCNGVLLNTFIQLKVVREKYWQGKPAEELLELKYRKKNEVEESIKMQKMQQNTVGFVPKKPPMWVPSHLAQDCSDCQREFSLIMRRVHHCRYCGKCFCIQCSNWLVIIPEFGYMQPVRVCRLCRDHLAASANFNAVTQETE
jgi:FYVE zinc finger